MNPYEVLGVRTNASSATIRKAHRKKVKETHPDVGGSPEAFAAVQQAYRILSDPVLRKRYDETGIVDDKPDNRASAANDLLCQAFMQALLEVEKMGQKPTQVDLKFHMDRELRKTHESISQMLDGFVRARLNWESMKGRFETQGDNLFEAVLAVNIRQLTQKIDCAHEQRSCIERAQQLLSQYTYRSDGSPNMFTRANPKYRVSFMATCKVMP